MGICLMKKSILALAAAFLLTGMVPQDCYADSSSFDNRRSVLRNELLNDRASSVQRRAIASGAQKYESPENKAKRQRYYYESASMHGAVRLAEKELREGHNTLDDKDLKALSQWAREEDVSSIEQYKRKKELESMQGERRSDQRRSAMQNWASGKTDIRSTRRQVRNR